jgi:hypothetical protein
MNYMTLQVCGARFQQQFDSARSELQAFLKSKEVAFPRELTDKVWNAIAKQFQKVEVALTAAGDAQLHAECEQASKQAAALTVAGTEQSTQGPPLATPLAKKDF